ncbi:MAG: 2-oxoglutarate ferredoxin oxidoreductase subunit gamma [Proteobacteria bacterium]|nr:2-oxoglutarate ferredoxin oxidoreductase subunit gamma [Pseudomonadota bacterium]
MKDRIELLASGFGGQGVVRLGQIVGTAAVNQGYRVTMLKSHGTEQRGGYVRTQLVLSSEEIDSPLVESPDYFCAMSSAAYKQFGHMIGDGIVLYDPAMVEIDESKPFRQISVPAKNTAIDKLGRAIYANIIMLGALSGAAAEVLDKENVLETMLKIIPKFKDENKTAFDLGYSMATS